ncbi:MAG: hypothetical protein RMI34_12160 [Chloroherpetonaceae bacterium]|nr:hypothetical protein [Chloroherpetonaceae bacterium]MDW8020811.1 hypothetical protein [Chloroherpetonaceae bacterium]
MLLLLLLDVEQALAQKDSSTVRLTLRGHYDGARISRGQRDEEDVIRTLKSQERFILACLQAACAELKLSDAKGTLQLRLLIQPDGYASDVQILRAPLPINAIQECIQKIFSRSHFRKVRENDDQQILIEYTIE